MRFYVGVHVIQFANRLKRAFISVNGLEGRKSGFPVNDWILDSGAFTTLARLGAYPKPPAAYAAQIRQWSQLGGFEAAVAQDYMCEAPMLRKTGLTVAQHMRMTVERYDALMACDLGGAELIPVLQGFEADDYLRCIELYGDRLAYGARVGVGSVCKRNGSPQQIIYVLAGIARMRPDLRLHGFGIKQTSLSSPEIRELLYSADSMAWSYAARREGRNPNSIEEAVAYEAKIERLCEQRITGGFFGG